MRITFIVSIICVSLFYLAPVSGQDATAIVKKAEDKMRGESMSGEMKMTIIRPTWTREMSFKTWAEGDDFSLVLITSPKRDAGTAFLRRENEIWNWQPTIERSVKLPPSMMSQSWMGSDFSNDDLVRMSSMTVDFTHHFAGYDEVSGQKCYKIKLLPKPNAAVVWGKVIMWISTDDYLELKTEFYDEDNELVNTMIGSGVKEMDGRLIPTKLTVLPADEEGRKTIVEYLTIDFGVDFPSRFFTIQNMKRL